MVDDDGFRPNVGIVLSNSRGMVFWARRAGKDSWQFPQGGIKHEETPEEAMYRELDEETGLSPDDVEIMGCTRNWLRYRLPSRYIRKHQSPLCIGQKQIWYMLRLVGDESNVQLDKSDHPEFDSWRWVDYWLPMQKVIFFKRDVYRGALEELEPLLNGGAVAGEINSQ